ncbi:50S ribosomal protein L23 [Crocinitomix catalasitica]|uniref:50S ribosomal protein L23 n=1 Tax=Crocinitomix catalasitica TaxID=184607 RepID=UPI000482423A|nr:50S ribosomal protein L23 [Crocinitomix catalasitica]
MNNMIKKPLLTEKATLDSELNNRYAFVVDRRANKLEIKDAIENLYGVTVENVRTMTYGGGKAKRKYTSRGVAEQTNSIWKKAIVTVAEGEDINLYDNI